MIYPKNFEQKTGFDAIRKLVAGKCTSDPGKKEVEGIRFSARYEEIRTWLLETNEFLIINREEDFPLGPIPDLAESLGKIRIEGTHLEVNEVSDMRKSADTARSVLNFFQKGRKERFPNLTKLCEQVKYYPYVAERINKILTKNDKIKDNASHELAAIRQGMRHLHDDVTRMLNKILKSLQSEGIVDRDAVLSIRNARPVIPVNTGFKRKIRGIIHDESASGKTSFIEPAEVVEINNEIKELEYAERREIIRILIDLTNDLRPYLEDLLESLSFLATIDFIRAKALFAGQVGGIMPELKENCMIRWDNAIHPLLLLSHRKENREVVPLNISLDEKQRILLISGPNAGGKSVCLKTVGLLQYMLQCGLLVPMNEDSSAGIFERLFIDIGDEQSIENDLSTYSSHLLNMKFFLRNTNSNTLVLIDEFGTGTEPMLGGAIAEAILEQLNALKSYGVITTHYSNLKHFASEAEGIINGAMLFDTQNMQPLFRLEIGQPGSSFAFEIARNIGLSDDIIKDATGKVGEEQIEFDKHLKNIIRDKRYWETKRENIRKAEKKLQQVLESYTRELESVDRERKDILKKAREEAETLFAETNKRIENTIRQIREAQAEKEKTRKAREELNVLRKKTGVTEKQEERDMGKKLERLREETGRVKERRRKFGQLEPAKSQPRQDADTTIKQGDYVFLKGQNTPGLVTEIKGELVTVNFGHLSTKVNMNKLEKTSPEVYDEMHRLDTSSGDYDTWDISYRKLHFRPEIDVRGKRVEEALREVTELVDEAVMVETDEVRILHGKGDGILRQVIREYLRTIPVVKSFRDEHIQLGGAGITVVTLDL